MHLFCDLPHDSIEALRAENLTLTRRLANSTRLCRARAGHLAVLREEIHRLQRRVRNLRRSNAGLRLAAKELLPQRGNEVTAEYAYLGGKLIITPTRTIYGTSQPDDTPAQRIPEAEDHLLVYPYGQPSLQPTWTTLLPAPYDPPATGPTPGDIASAYDLTCPYCRQTHCTLESGKLSPLPPSTDPSPQPPPTL